MSYCVVQTIKKGSRSNETEFSTVPPGWIDTESKTLYWPRIDYVDEIVDENSTKKTDWIPRILVKVWHTDLSREEADTMVKHYVTTLSSSELSGTEDDNHRSNKRPLVVEHRTLPQTPQYSLVVPSPVMILHYENYFFFVYFV